MCTFCNDYIPQKGEIYLNLVLDFVPETVYRVTRQYSREKKIMPVLFIKVSAPLIISFFFEVFLFAFSLTERRNLPEPSAGLCAGKFAPVRAPLQQDEEIDSHDLCEGKTHPTSS